MAVSLVTGACGFMGTHMVEVLAEAGHTVRATDLASCYVRDDFRRGRYPGVLRKMGVEFIPADLGDPRRHPQALERLLEGVEYLFHIAAIFNYSAPWELLWKVNVEGTRNLLDRLPSVPSLKKIVLWGAAGIFRFPKRSEENPITEETPKELSNNYLKSKWAQEDLLRRFCQRHSIPHTIVRGTTVYGPRAIYGGGQLILDPLRMKKLAVPRNFTFRIPTGHVRDICRAALFSVEHPETDGEDYNVNDDSQTATVEFMRLMAEITGRPFRWLPPVPVRLVRAVLTASAVLGRWRQKLVKGRPPRFERDLVQYFGRDVVISNEKLKKAGFEWQYPTFEKGLRETVPWYLDHWEEIERARG